jgi:hypothetical protein
MVKPDNPADVVSAASLTSLAETDEAGRFRIENIPPGNYYIVAGRVDQPTYYPGTAEIRGGRLIAVAAGETVSGIDFSVADSSFRVAGVSSSSGVTVTVRFKVDDNGKLPVSSGGGITTIRLTRVADGVRTDVAMNQSTTVFQPSAAGFRVSVEQLPADYEVKSMTYGSLDLTTTPLRVGMTNNSTTGLTRVTDSLGRVVIVGTFQVFSTSTNLAFTLSTMLGAPAASPNEIVVTLGRKPSAQDSHGVRVSGRARPSEVREIYLSGKPGTLFSDGTFEFADVPAGLHPIATIDTPGRALGAAIIVGSQDVSGVELDDVPILPADIQTQKPPGSAVAQHQGTVIPLATFHGRFVDEATMEPLVGALLIVSGSKYLLDEDGRVEITRLLPGHYDVEIQIRGHAPAMRSFDVQESNLEVEWKIP